MKTLMPVVILAGLAAMPPAQAQSNPRYDAIQRARVGPLDSCMKDEVMNGAFCVKQCAPGFKLELGKRSGTCVGESPTAKIPPPKPPEYVPPAKIEPGAKGDY